jgi:DNA-binding winged helix-turn-helix (wHTH) protein
MSELYPQKVLNFGRMDVSVSPNSSSRIIRFSTFELNLHTGELRQRGQKVKLQEQPLQVLAALLERPGEMVTREELRNKLWPADTFVDFDHSLNAAIKRLRDALGESADAPVFIETLARRGYRFIAPVNGSSTPSGIEIAPADLLVQIRGSRSNKLSVVLAVVNGTTSVSTAVDAGANFVLGKPVEAKMLHCILDLALPRMEREHRRYFRHKVELPIELLCFSRETVKPIGRRCRSAFRQPSLKYTRGGWCFQDHGGTDEERAALVNAMSGIRILRMNVASWLDHSCQRKPVQNERSPYPVFDSPDKAV